MWLHFLIPLSTDSYLCLHRNRVKFLIYSVLIFSFWIVKSLMPLLAMEAADLHEKRTIRILTIDGGEIPGIIPVTILERMEEILRSECGEKACLADCFDLMVGTSEGALTLLLLNTIDPENNSCLYSARKIYTLYQQGLLPDRNKDSLREKTGVLFSERWLSESHSRLYLPVCNVGQPHPWILDSEEAKRFKSQDFKMSDVAYVGMLDPSDAEVIENRDGDPDYKLCDTKAIYGDATFEGLQKAIRLFPKHNFFIASLGVGEVARAYGFHGGRNFDTLSAQVNQDRHLNHFYELKRLIEEELNGSVNYIRIQLSLDLSTIQDPAALRQAGLSVSNSQNPHDYPAFKIITEELRKAYKERFLQIIPREISFKKVNHSRPWKSITNKVFPFYLPAPSEEKFIESAEEVANAEREEDKKSYLTMLWESLHQTGITTLSAKAAIAGMGGIGKSSLALKYAYEACENYAYNMIYWLPSETELQLCEGYRELLQDLEVPLKGDETFEQLLRKLNNYILKKNFFFLLVYDNVPNPNFLHNKTPQKGGHVLITSRCNERWGNNTILLDVFRPQDSIQYFLNVTGVEPSDENKIKAESLAKELGYLPLALSHAASYIKFIGGDAVSGKHFDEYLDAFRKEPNDHFEEYKDPFSEHQAAITYQHLITKTWTLSGRIISDLAKQLMVYCSYLSSDSIPENVFLEYCGGEKKLQETLAQLRSFSLIKKEQDKSLFSIHRLVQLVIRQEEENTEHFMKFNRMLLSFNAYHQSKEHEFLEYITPCNSEKCYMESSVFLSNLEALNSHLNHLSKASRNLNKEEWLKLRFGATALQKLMGDYLESLRKKIREKTGADVPESRNKLKLSILMDELKERNIPLKLETCEEIVDVLPDILSLELNNEIITYIAEVIAEIACQERRDFVSTIKALLACGIDESHNIHIKENGAANVIRGFYSKYPDHWDRFVESTRPFFISRMEKREEAYVTRAFRMMNPSQRPQFIHHIQSLFAPQVTKTGLSRIMEALYNINPMERCEFARIISPLLTPDMEEHDWANVICILSKINLEQLRETAIVIQTLLTPSILGNDRASIIYDLSKMNLMQLCEFIEVVQPLLNCEIAGRDRADIIYFVSKQNPKQRPEFMKIINSLLTPEMTGYNRADLVGILDKINSADHHEFIEIMQPLLTPEVGGYDWAYVVEILDKDNLIARRDIPEITPGMFQSYKEGLQQYLNKITKINQDAVKEIHAVTKSSKLAIVRLPDRPRNFIETDSFNLLQNELCSKGKAVVVGMGGIGKTQLALNYAYEASEQGVYDLIYWIWSETEASFLNGYKNLLQDLKIFIEQDAPSDYLINLVKHYIPQKGKCLLIYDNVPYPSFLYDKIPKDTDILITSLYNGEWCLPTIRLHLFSPEEAVTYLFEKTGIERTEKNKLKANILAQELDYLPLALAQAAGYIKYSNCTLGDYLKIFKKNSNIEITPHFTDYQDSYKTRMQKSIKMISEKISPLGNKLMEYFSYLEPDLIIQDIFWGCAEEGLSLLETKEKVESIFDELYSFSLIHSSNQFFSIHRLTQSVMREEQELRYDKNLFSFFNEMLSSFDRYRQFMEYKLTQDLEPTDLIRWYTAGSALEANLQTVSFHIQRIFQSENLNKERGVKLTLGILSLRELLGVPLALLRKEIHTKLERIKPEKDQKQLKDILQALELQEKNNLNSEAREKATNNLPIIFSLEPTNKDTIYIAEIIAKTASSEQQISSNIIALNPGGQTCLSTFRRVNSAQRYELVDIIQPFLLPEMTEEQQTDVIWAFYNVEFDCCHEFAEIVHSLLGPEITSHNWIEIMWAIRWVDHSQRRELINILQPLLTNTPEKNKWTHIISSMVSIMPEKRIDICKNFIYFWELSQKEEAYQNQEQSIKKILESIIRKKDIFGIVDVCLELADSYVK